VRCFLGLPLPGAYQEGLAELRRQLAPGLASRLTWTRPGNWHLTLKFLGEVDQARIPGLCAELAGIEHAPVTLQAAGGGVFPDRRRPRVLWAGLGRGGRAAAGLAALVDAACVHQGFAPREREFRPHLTVARVKRPARDDWAGVLKKMTGRTWPVIEVPGFALWQSLLKPEGPEYRVVETFALSRPG
jgi:2'-5' RNA ligase